MSQLGPPQTGDASATPPAGSGRSLIERAAAGEALPRPPVWFMRQAGRSLPEYRASRAGTQMLQACREPSLVSEITMQPVRRHGVDAAIFFSDIVVPLAAVDVGVDIVPGVGPVVAQPFATRADLDRLPRLEAATIPDITQSVQRIVAELGERPLIGFAGAPFTLASYLIEGGPSKNHQRTKALMHGDPQLWHDLCQRLAQISGEFLRVQVLAGARAIQLFDSWVGALPRSDYERFARPYSSAALDAVADLGVPRIHFGVGTGELLGSMAQAGAEVVGVDYRVALRDAADRVGPRTALQGNLDPALLFAPWAVIEDRVRQIVAEGRGAHGHIFNLGHGVLPGTDPGVLTAVVDLIKGLVQPRPGHDPAHSDGQ